METDSWQQKIDITSQLFNESSKFSYIQAIRLLKLEFQDKHETSNYKIRTHPRLSLDFPHSDIIDIEKIDEFIKLTVTFMGLYGESSPLPTFYTEMLLEEEQNDKSVMREFIDIFNAPIYENYFKVWLKNQLGIRLNEFQDPKVLNFLHLFSGMPSEHLRKKYKNSYAPLRYAGLNMQFPRSAEALRSLVCDITQSDDVEIIQCVKQMAPIPQHQHCSLGRKNSVLDQDLHLGDKIKDRMGKFRITISNLSFKDYNALLPQTKKFQYLLESVRIYIGESLDWDLELFLKDDARTNIVLGGSNDSKLGLNTWLDHKKGLRTLFIDINQYKVDKNGSK